MFERFTDPARRVIVLAQEESREFRHNYIGTEHLLLGLIKEQDGIAAKALVSLNVSLDDARREVERIIGRGEAVHAGHLPFTPRAKRTLELALPEALKLGHNYIGTEHLLLGMLRDGEGIGARVLIELGAGLNDACRAVVELLVSSSQETTVQLLDQPQRTTADIEHDLVIARARLAQLEAELAEATSTESDESSGR